MKKRILSLLLCLVMVVGLLPVTALADMNMADYHGKRITEIVLEASIDLTKIPDYLSGSITADSNAYDASKKIVEVGKELGNGEYMIRFNPISYTYTNGTATTTFDNSGATELLEVEISGIQWQKSDGKWDWASDQMTHYLDGQYRYQFNVSVVENKEDSANEYRIVPNVKVTVKWKNSSVQETLTVDPKRVYNHDESFHSYATFTTAPFAATVDTGLKLVAAGSIPSGYANEAIKSFSVASWASGGTKPYKFYKVDGPKGITVDLNGTVHGAPTEESDSPKKLKIKVIDSTEGTPQEKTIEIDVGKVKEARIVIQSIEIAGLSYPRVGDVVPRSPGVYITKIVDSNGNVISRDKCPIYLTISRDWENEAGKSIYTNDNYTTDQYFMAGGKYRFAMQVRLDGKENCEKYYLPKTFTAIVPSFVGGEEGSNKMTVSRTGYMDDEEYISLFVESPKWEAVDTGNILTGTVSYSGAARYGQRLTANVTGLPEGVSKADLSYQWQFKNKDHDIWYDVYYNDTEESITLNDELGISDLVGRDIRVTVRCTGTNFAGMLYGASKKVTKDVAPGAPAVTQLTVTPGTDNKATVTIGNYYEAVEYVYTTTPATSWPTDGVGTPITAKTFTVDRTANPQTIYVYARNKATETREGGVYYSGASALIPGTAEIMSARDMIYPDYDSKTPTIYLKKGEEITVKYQLDPNNANDNLPQWKGTYTATDSTDASVSVENNETAKALKITAGAATGTVDVVAYKDASATYLDRWTYGTGGDSSAGRQITVKIYDPNDLSTVPFPYLSVDMGAVEMYVGDTYTVDEDKMKEALVLPDDVDKSKYTYSAYVVSGDAGSAGGQPPVGATAKDGSVTMANNVITAKQAGSATVHVFALKNDDSMPTNIGSPGHYAYFNVTVKARPTVLDLSITPPVLTLQAGKTYQLVATKTPTASDDTFTWSSDKPDVVTVIADKNDSSKATVTAMATATAGTKATITAKYGDGTTALTANCIITVTAACGENHAYVLYQEQDWGHKKVCLFCGEDEKENGKIKVEPHDLYESTEDPNVLLCSYCDHSAKLTADTTDETVAPSSPSGGHHGGAGRPYRPGLSTAAPGGTTTAAVQSPKTGDAGIMLYAALSLMSMTGGAWLVSKKRRDR